MAKEFDLEKRTTEFAKAVIKLCKRLPRNPINDRVVGQVVGAAGSVGANYREANDSIGNKDIILRMKIARREAKESQHWLELILEANNNETDIRPLIKESIELIKILSSIIIKLQQ
ncbi:MAG: four helix bundle protein [Dehalococcoidales bacterium]